VAKYKVLKESVVKGPKAVLKVPKLTEWQTAVGMLFQAAGAKTVKEGL